MNDTEVEAKSESRLDDFEEEPTFDRRGTFVGTPFYVAPEML